MVASSTIWATVAACGLAGAGLIGYRLYKAGFFTPLKVEEKILGPYLVLYRNTTGPYSRLGQEFQGIQDLMVEMALWFREDKEKGPMMGLYFDNPRETPAEQCRATIGAVFKSGPALNNPEEVAKHMRFLSAITAIKRGEIKVALFPASRCLAVRAPYSGGQLSVLLAALRAYPLLTDALQQRPGHFEIQGSLEVYKGSEETMWVAFPLTSRKELMPFNLEQGAGSSAGDGSQGAATAAAGSGGAGEGPAAEAMEGVQVQGGPEDGSSAAGVEQDGEGAGKGESSGDVVQLTAEAQGEGGAAPGGGQ